MLWVEASALAHTASGTVPDPWAGEWGHKRDKNNPAAEQGPQSEEAHETPQKHNVPSDTAAVWTFHISPAQPGPAQRALPQRRAPLVPPRWLRVPTRLDSSAPRPRTGLGQPGTGQGGAAGQRARPARGSAGKRRRARGPGEGDPPGGGEKPPALINHWELTAGKAKARPGSSAPGTHPLLCRRAGPETGSGGGCGQARGAGRCSP